GARRRRRARAARQRGRRLPRRRDGARGSGLDDRRRDVGHPPGRAPGSGHARAAPGGRRRRRAGRPARGHDPGRARRRARGRDRRRGCRRPRGAGGERRVRVYLLVMLVAATVTFLATPFARWVALRTGAITAVRDRDVHTIPTPRLGGGAMLLGLVVAVVFASQMPFLEGVFVGEVAGRLVADPRAWGIVGAAAIVCVLGVADDIWDLDWMTKLAGQVLAAGLMATQGVVLFTLPIGIGDQQLIWSSRLQLAATILVVVVAMNAVNFVDGLDGLAAGLVAIGGSAFFVYSYVL